MMNKCKYDETLGKGMVMADILKTNLLVQVARMYYEHNWSQQHIAEEIGFPRPYVSKLINEARECGIVEIKINDPNAAESPVEQAVRTRFGLQKVIAVPFAEDYETLLVKIAHATSRFLNTIVRENDIIGVSWGNTLYVCSLHLRVVEEFANISVVQMCGGVSLADKYIYASEIPKRFADAYKGTPYLLPLPALVDSIGLKEAIVRDKNISEILEMGKKVNIGLFSVGVFGHDKTLAGAGYISREKVDELLGKGAVGDMCSRIIDINGRICDEGVNQRTIGIDLDELKNKKYSIAVSGGLFKAKCTYAALKGGYANVLITDEGLAKELIRLHDSAE